MTVSPDFQAAQDAWRAARMAKLSAEDGWLNLLGRWVLTPGKTVTIGSAPGSDIKLEVGPDTLGELTLKDGDTATFERDGEVRTLDRKAGGFAWREGRFLLEITALNDIRALRIRDAESAARETPPEIDSFPLDPALRITARWEKLPEPITITMDNMSAIPTQVPVTHVARLTLAGHEMALLPTYGSADRPQFVIRDLTSLDDTYPHMRFIFGEEVTEDSVVIDFNRAVNPPCAYTRHAVCPLPPRENLFPVRIEAGERRL